jgi:hypothetical protein
MKIIDLKITKETKNYKYIFVQYTPWLFPNTIKSRYVFITKKTNDCFWSDTGKRLIASTERAVLAWVEEISDVSANVMLRKLNLS